ncbi:uncharacterized protein LOC127445552 [Myxocyprinus asiaticus]|uniref:uncharacterized protein LOC127445552 n=1 Tax=Myxocyprinus asiaticus TaxID=70543 RepID=UPI002222A74B|nr:uncharacterized protein LOC127445552 [Myxocyprinus asiaticus]
MMERESLNLRYWEITVANYMTDSDGSINSSEHWEPYTISSPWDHSQASQDRRSDLSTGVCSCVGSGSGSPRVKPSSCEDLPGQRPASLPVQVHRARTQTRPCTRYRCKTKRNPHNLRPLCTSAPAPLSFSVGLCNIPAFDTQFTLSILALTETWIHPEDTATPAALSNNFSFSHTPRNTSRGGGTGQLTNFLEELDVLLSSLPEDGRPLVVLGDFNIHQDKPQATELNTLLASFDLEKLHTTATHRSGNQLELIFSCQHVLHHPASGCLTSFVNIRLTSGQLRGDGRNLKIQQI